MVDVEAKALVDKVAVTLRETDAKTIGQPLSEALVDKLKNTLKDAETQTLGYKRGYVEAMAIVDTKSNTLPEAKSETHGDTWAMWRPRNWSKR